MQVRVEYVRPLPPGGAQHEQEEQDVGRKPERREAGVHPGVTRDAGGPADVDARRVGAQMVGAENDAHTAVPQRLDLVADADVAAPVGKEGGRGDVQDKHGPRRGRIGHE